MKGVPRCFGDNGTFGHTYAGVMNSSTGRAGIAALSKNELTCARVFWGPSASEEADGQRPRVQFVCDVGR